MEGNMRHVIVRRGGLIAAAAAALLVAGGGLAVASASSSASVSGPEVVSGAVHGKAALANVTHIPLTLAGVVGTTDRGFALGPGGGNTHSLATPAGKLTVRGTGKQAQTQTLNPKSCRFSDVVRQKFNFVPNLSTGAFAGASGPGAYQITFAAYAPRYTSGPHKGQCDTSNNAQPLAKGAIASFLAAGVLTVK
jgi:hypothetical protein